MQYLSVKNLRKFQHYSKRRPPWIKLHAELFDDYAFQCLQDASKAHLIQLWLLASQMDNRIPYDKSFITRKLGATEPVDIEELVLKGFLEISAPSERDASTTYSTTLAARKQSAMPETETETETETEKKRGAPVGASTQDTLPGLADAPPPARASGRKTPSPPKLAVKTTWLTPYVERWSEGVGVIPKPQMPRFAAALSPVVERYGADGALAGLERYLRHVQESGRVAKIEWFAQECVRWCEGHAALLTGADGCTDEAAVLRYLGAGR